MFFSALRASFWSKNKGGTRAPRAPTLDPTLLQAQKSELHTKQILPCERNAAGEVSFKWLHHIGFHPQAHNLELHTKKTITITSFPVFKLCRAIFWQNRQKLFINSPISPKLMACNGFYVIHPCFLGDRGGCSILFFFKVAIMMDNLDPPPPPKK